MTDYIQVVYDKKTRPETDYPQKLCKHLFDRFGMKPGMKLLEAGCGRGEFLKNFKTLGLEVYGADISPEAPKLSPDVPIKVCDIETKGLDFPDSHFDIVYSKSFIEHLADPGKYFREAFRVLKPGGRLITLVPDWESNYKIYFDDYTHRSPFAAPALEDIYKIFGFRDILVLKFRQLPVVWEYPALNCLCAAVAPFVPVRTENKFLKWSRELMLLGCGTKHPV